MMKQNGFIRPGFEFAAGKNGFGSGYYGGIGNEQHGFGTSVRSLFGLGIGGQDGQEFSFDFGEFC